MNLVSRYNRMLRWYTTRPITRDVWHHMFSEYRVLRGLRANCEPPPGFAPGNYYEERNVTKRGRWAAEKSDREFVERYGMLYKKQMLRARLKGQSPYFEGLF